MQRTNTYIPTKQIELLSNKEHAESDDPKQSYDFQKKLQISQNSFVLGQEEANPSESVSSIKAQSRALMSPNFVEESHSDKHVIIELALEDPIYEEPAISEEED